MSKIRSLAPLIAAIITGAIISLPFQAYADDGGGKRKHQVVSREETKTRTDSGHVRSVKKTAQNGAVASRLSQVERNKEAGTRTKSVSGTTFDGKHYSGENTKQKTDSGYTAEGHFEHSDGKSIDRSVTATVDKEANSVSKEISVTAQGEETKTRSVVRPLKRSRE